MNDVRLVNRTFDILELFVNSAKEEIRISELAKLTGLDKATANRIAFTMVNRGYLRQKEKRGKYSLGTKFLDYSGIIKKRNNIRNIAMPLILKLTQLLDESIILSILDESYDRKTIYNETIHTNQPLRIVPDEGTQFQFPLYCTSVGKIFLAAMAEPELDSYLNSTKIKAYTANTITDINQLKTHLKRVAKEGVAFDNEEHILGARAVSTGIKDVEGKVVAAVAVLGPTIRLTRRRVQEIIPDLKNCASEISKQLGYKGQ